MRLFFFALDNFLKKKALLNGAVKWYKQNNTYCFKREEFYTYLATRRS